MSQPNYVLQTYNNQRRLVTTFCYYTYVPFKIRMISFLHQREIINFDATLKYSRALSLLLRKKAWFDHSKMNSID